MKKIISLSMSLMIVVMLCACTQDDASKYLKYYNKTMGVTKGKSSFNMIITNEGLEVDEQINESLETMEISYNGNYDHAERKAIGHQYTKIGDMGIDLDIFFNGDNRYIKIPFSGKYVKVDDMSQDYNVKFDFIDTTEIVRLWNEMLKTDDVIEGKKVLLDTEEGKVKATKYTVKLTNEQLDHFITDVSDIVLSDEERLNKFLYDMGVKDEEAVKELKAFLFNFKVKDVVSYVYVNIDGYIVEQQYELVVESSDLMKSTIKLNIQDWDFEKEQAFDFPVIEESDILDLEQLNDEEIKMNFEGVVNK